MIFSTRISHVRGWLKRSIQLAGLLICLAHAAASQSVTVLHQVMSLDPMIARPLAFRALQDSLADTAALLAREDLLSEFYGEVSDVRRSLRILLDTSKIELKLVGNNKISISFANIDTSLNLPPNVNAFLDAADTLVYRFMLNAIMRGVNQLPSGKLQASLLNSLSSILEITNGDSVFVNGQKVPSAIPKVAQYLATRTMRELKNLARNIPQDPIGNRLPDLQHALRVAVSAVAEVGHGILNQVEHTIAQVYSSASKYLLSGAVGARLGGNSGSFTPGIVLTVPTTTNFHWSLFLNGDLGKNLLGNSSATGLAGAQLRGVVCKERVEIDAIASWLFGEHASGGWEVGIGATTDWIHQNFILGGAVYYLKASQKVLIAGGSVSYKAPGAPTLFVGMQNDGGLAMHISFPVIPGLR